MEHRATGIRNTLRRCKSRLSLVSLAIGLTFAVVGGFFTATLVGSFIGIPMMLVAFPLIATPVRTEVCT